MSQTRQSTEYSIMNSTAENIQARAQTHVPSVSQRSEICFRRPQGAFTTRPAPARMYQQKHTRDYCSKEIPSPAAAAPPKRYFQLTVQGGNVLCVPPTLFTPPPPIVTDGARPTFFTHDTATHGFSSLRVTDTGHVILRGVHSEQFCRTSIAS